MKRISLPAALAIPLLLAACEPSGNDPGPGGVTVDEAAALDEAAEMVEAERLPEGTLPSASPDNDAPEPAEPENNDTAEQAGE